MQEETFALFAQDRTETAQALRECNARTARYQLTLSEAEIGMLLGAREDALQASGRVELGESILPRLALALCDSPYIQQADYAQTLSLSPAEQTRLLHKIRTLPRGAGRVPRTRTAGRGRLCAGGLAGACPAAV